MRKLSQKALQEIHRKALIKMNRERQFVDCGEGLVKLFKFVGTWKQLEDYAKNLMWEFDRLSNFDKKGAM